MVTPLVSIVIPCWNAVRYVGEAIESALAQTYPNREVIVIDDGSTDDSIDVIRSYGDRTRWESGPNRGACAARNRGIELAVGDFIQFLDADDLLYPEKIERQISAVVRESHSIVYSDFVVTDMTTGEALEVPTNHYAGEDGVVFALRRPRLRTAAPIHRKEHLLSIGGFDETLSCAQEYDLHCRLACEGLGWVHLPEVLYTCRRVEGSVSGDLIRVLDQHAGIIARLHKQLRTKRTLTPVRQSALATVLASDARMYLRHGYSQRARTYFRLARALDARDGIRGAYSPPTMLVRSILGAALTEKLVVRKRQFGVGRNAPAADQAGGRD